jgi:hypothetical protein
MKILVCIRDEFTRDQQIYVGKPTEDIHDEDAAQGWKDASGAIVVATITADDIEFAIAEVAKFYGCSVDRFEGYQIV